jgi:hypothetical protein
MVQLIPYIYSAFVPFGRYFTSIHLSLWIRQSPLSSHALTLSLLPKNHMLFIVSLKYSNNKMGIKGILSTKIVIFSYPKLLSFSVLTFIKWRLTPSYAAKDTIFWQKRPKTIVIRIIVHHRWDYWFFNYR